MPDRFFVMHEGFLQLALLLKDAGKVGVSCSKLWEHLFNTHTNLNILQENGSWVYVELQTRCDKRILKNSNLKSFPVQLDSIFNIALLPFDVGQVIEGVSMCGAKTQCCVVTFLSFRHLKISCIHNKFLIIHCDVLSNIQKYSYLIHSLC